MHRFRGNIWDYDSKPQVMQALRYPLSLPDRVPEITEARNIELGLGLQVFSLTFYDLVIFRNLLTYCWYFICHTKYLEAFHENAMKSGYIFLSLFSLNTAQLLASFKIQIWASSILLWAVRVCWAKDSGTSFLQLRKPSFCPFYHNHLTPKSNLIFIFMP